MHFVSSHMTCFHYQQNVHDISKHPKTLATWYTMIWSIISYSLCMVLIISFGFPLFVLFDLVYVHFRFSFCLLWNSIKTMRSNYIFAIWLLSTQSTSATIVIAWLNPHLRLGNLAQNRVCLMFDVFLSQRHNALMISCPPWCIETFQWHFQVIRFIIHCVVVEKRWRDFVRQKKLKLSTNICLKTIDDSIILQIFSLQVV